jgi:DNA modification methylase
MSEAVANNGSTSSKLNQEQKTQYVLVSFPLEGRLNEFEKELVASIGNKFKNNGFVFEIDDYYLHFYLKSLDFEGFKKHLSSCIDNEQSPVERYTQINQLLLELLRKIESIKSYGIKGKKRIYGNYNKERKVENRQNKIKNRGSHYYTMNNGFSKINNELPEEFRDKIIIGDSEAELKKLPSNCVDLIITSPPYNFGLGYDTSEDGINWECYFSKLFAIFDECIRVLKYGGRIIINIQPLFSDYIPSHHIISDYFRKEKLIWKGEILWEKNNYNCKYTAWGSWKSPSNPYLKYTWEFLEIFSKGDLKKEGNKEDIDIDKEEFKKWVVAKWSISPERKMEKYEHPAMFPEELIDRALKLFSYKGDIILDPFNGVGTTSVVAKKLGRHYIGIDISEKYCDIAKKRVKEIQQQLIQ